MSRKRRVDSRGRRRLKQWISQTKGSFVSEPTPPAVIDRFIELEWPKIWLREFVGGEEEICKAGFVEGLGRIVRDEMHRFGQDGEDEERDADPRQLDLGLWPEDEREIAAEIGVRAIYVPSRGTYVPLHDEDQISTAEIREGEAHLLKFSAQLARRAGGCGRLADHRDRRAARAA